MDKTKNIFVGAIAAIVVVGLLIFTIETDRSFLQMVTGFILFIFPFMFISSFASKIMSFILASFTIIFGYVAYKMGFHDFWIGIIQAFVIGGAIYYYRIRTTKISLQLTIKNKQKNKEKMDDKEINIFSQGLNFIKMSFI